MINVIILAGGHGTRLWPLSRTNHPKQFLSLYNSHSLLQNTLLRVQALQDVKKITIVANEEHRFFIAEQVRQLNCDLEIDILLESQSKNTSPAICLAVSKILDEDQNDSDVLVLSSDHYIKNGPEFNVAVNNALEATSEHKIVALGVPASRPETGYGYISFKKCADLNWNEIESFVEKPNLELAQSYVDSGTYLWNSGIFVFRASDLKREYERLDPKTLDLCDLAVQSLSKDLDFLRVDGELYKNFQSASFDVAIMEKTNNAAVVVLGTDWSDVGSFHSIWEIQEKDENGNVILGDCIADNANNNFITSDKRLVVASGVDDLVIADTDDATLVTTRSNAGNLKDVVTKLKKLKRSETEYHKKVIRPWGNYEVIVSGERFQVKRLEVKPGQQLSSQKHYHRAEHWVVVSGTALVYRDDEELLLAENESTFLSVGVKHSLKNPGKIPLVIIEVQSGAYLGEDDIVRFSDIYGRA